MSTDSDALYAARREDYFSERRDMWMTRARDAARDRDMLTNVGDIRGAAEVTMLVQQYARVARFNNWNALLARRRGGVAIPRAGGALLW